MSVRRRLSTACAIVLSLVATVLGTGTAVALPAAASARLVTYGVEPANVTGPDGRPFFSYGVTAGASVTDHVAVLNYSDVPLTLVIYATDALNTPSGGLSLLPAAERPLDAGSWLSLGHRPVQVRIAPRTGTGPGRVTLPFTVTVPRTASPGDHVGGIVASLSTLSTNAQGTHVRLDQRIASRVYVRVSGTLTPRLTLDRIQATYRGTLDPVGQGSVAVSYTVRNTGNLTLAGHQRVVVSGPLGETSAGALPDIGLLLPGGAETVTVVVPGVWPALWMNATVTISPVKPAGATDPSLTPISSGAGVLAVPWILLVVLALLAGGGTWAYRRQRGGVSVSPPPTDRVPALTRRSAPAAAGWRARGAAALGVALVALAAQAALAPTARADTALPYSDASAVGYVGLCDRAGHAVNHGSIHDKPFVWRAVSSVIAPAPYNGLGRTATLFAFQPRVGTAPGQWSGELVTASAKYSNPARPMAQATAADGSLADYLGDYPTMLDGLVQLRIYLGVPGQPADTLTYAATDIKVTGDTWTVVRGANLPCTGGSAVSLEALLPTTTPAAASVRASAPTGGQTKSAGTATGTSASSSPALVAAGDATAASSASGPSAGWVGAVMVIVLLGVGARVGAVALARRGGTAD